MESSAPDVYHALADGHRRKLLDLLLEREWSVQDLAALFPISLPAVSQHLKVLSDAGLVTRRKAGRRRLYRARPEGLAEVDRWCARHRAFWDANLERLADYLERAEE